MKRKITKDLHGWLSQPNRKPLVIRGARQVGKTWLVREFASQANLHLFELNFERDIEAKELFIDNDPNKTILRLGAFFNKEIIPNVALLFLDEIQAAPEILAKLRWFAEEMPELAIIATGSLLDFTLNEHTFSMPVGRINYLYMEPMSFEEFLLALGQDKLCEFLANYQLNEDIPVILHKRLNQFLREYIFIGGMPAAVENWIINHSFEQINKVQRNILTTYQDDFSKYAKRANIQILIEVFKTIPKLLGRKFKYSAVNNEIQAGAIKNALNLLCLARVCHKVHACSSNGIPLSASTKPNYFKVIGLDIGIAIASMDLSFNDILKIDEIKLINEGGLAEQVVGQLLRTAFPTYIDPKLFYWLREKTGSEAEIDYVIQSGKNIFPIEVKAGKSGTLRSLHAFMKDKKINKAIRFNIDVPSATPVKIKDHSEQIIQYELLSLPIYLTEQIYRLIENGNKSCVFSPN